MADLMQDGPGCAEGRRYARWFADRLDAMWLLRKAHNERGMTTMTKPDLTEARRLAADLHCGDSGCKCTLNRSVDMLSAMADELERLRAQVAPTKTDLARIWRITNGSTRWGGDVDAFVTAWLATLAAPAQQATPIGKEINGLQKKNESQQATQSLTVGHGEPLFWFRPCGDLYEGPVHHKSVGGKMLRDEKPGEWLPLFLAHSPPLPLAAQAEPVAWMDPQSRDVIHAERKSEWQTSFGQGGQIKAATYTEPLYAAPTSHQPAQAEPVAYVDGDGHAYAHGTDGGHINLPAGTKLYTEPPSHQPAQAEAVARVRVQSRTIYVLNARGTNRWWATVNPGQDDDGKRVPDAECEAIARQLVSSHPAQGVDSKHARVMAMAGEQAAAFEKIYGGGSWIDPDFRDGRMTWMNAWRAALAQAPAAEPLTDEAKDAARYRWLRDCPYAELNLLRWSTEAERLQIDADVDAAMAAAKEQP